MQSFQWNATEYAKSSGAQHQWARELMRKLDLVGNERLLDIGCGDGKVTAEIASHVPNGYVVGIDSSESMISLAKNQYPFDAYSNLSFKLGDARSLQFYNEFDVVFSNATLHWIVDHKPVLRGIFGCLRRGGRALLQMGGRGNAADIMSTMESLMATDEWRVYFSNFSFQYGFFGIEEYQKWLPESGLETLRLELISKDMVYNDRNGLAGWIRTTWLPYTQRVPVTIREKFISQLIDTYLMNHPADASGIIHVGMMRLEVEARKR